MSMAIAPDPAITLRRRALYTALHAYLDEQALWEALLHWEACYAAQAAFPVQRFLSDILTTPDLRAQRPQILRSVVQALAWPEARLLPDPGERLWAYRLARHAPHASTPTPPSVSPSVPVAVSMTGARDDAPGDPLIDAATDFVGRLLDAVDAREQSALRVQVSMALEESRLSLAKRRALQTWLQQRNPQVLNGMGAAELRHLVSAVYVGLCEQIGPVAADATLDRALRALAVDAPHLLGVCRGLL